MKDVMVMGNVLPLKARIKELEEELEEAKGLVIEANNSLYGSQGYFYSMNGGPYNKHHLSEGIERLKSLNAQLMGDDEDKPRYTTKRLRQEIERATQELQKENEKLHEALEWLGVKLTDFKLPKA